MLILVSWWGLQRAALTMTTSWIPTYGVARGFCGFHSGPGSKDAVKIFWALCSQKEAVVETFRYLGSSEKQLTSGDHLPTHSENPRLPLDCLVYLYKMPSLPLWNILVQKRMFSQSQWPGEPHLLHCLAHFVLHTSFQPKVYLIFFFFKPGPSYFSWLKWG